jgi:hypothetical protein
MATVSNEPPRAVSQGRRALRQIVVSETWASLAIAAMWLAVALAAVFGPDFVSTGNGGMDSTRIPSAIVVGLFAYLGTRVVAKRAFGRPPGERD